MAAPRDPLNAFCRDNHVDRRGAPSGSLAGVTFAAKDVFDVEGAVTGAGQPDWLRTHAPADGTAPVVQALLDAGADLVGKTQTDELVYSLNGENAHYGTPLNPRAPGRIPGGSSSGSASAVAGSLVDVALGTDCAGSVRLPASYCGIFGFRPTHGCVSADRAVALAPSFDTVGWFARDGQMLERVGKVLLPASPARASRPTRLLLARDAFELAGPEVQEALGKAVDEIAAIVGRREDVVVHAAGLEQLTDWFRVLQAFEVWATHGAWITEVKPSFGPGIRERYQWASTVIREQTVLPAAERARFTAAMDRLLSSGDLLCVPTAPGIAPRLNTPAADLEVFRGRAISLLAIAGLAGLPQVSLPMGVLNGCPVGLSLIGRRDADLDVLAFASSLPPRPFA